MLRNIVIPITRILCVFFIFFSFQTHGQQSFFQLDLEPNIRPQGKRLIIPNKFQLAQISHNSIRDYLLSAPHEDQVSAKNSKYYLELPAPDGTMMKFSIVESPIFEPGLAEKFPNIKTYLGQGITDGTASVRLDISPSGFHAMIRSQKGTIYIDPYSQHNTEYSISYFRKDFQEQGGRSFVCDSENELIVGSIPQIAPISPEDQGTTAELTIPTGTELRKYRLALAAVGEYTVFHGGTVPLALAAMTTAINRVNEIYENDIAVRFILIANTNILIETNPLTDPYTNGTTNIMINEAQAEITTAIGSSNFDIGHLFGKDIGGLAQVSSVCNDSGKARSVAGHFNPVGDPFVDVVCHEIGHQFGALHAQNNTCARSAISAYEVASGSTIMSYAGVCVPNLQNSGDLLFNSFSYEQMQNFIDGNGSTCAETIPTTNNSPVADAGIGGYIIPISTPFELTGTGTDVDGDTLTYLWEQHDLGPETVTAADVNNPTGNAPIFRIWTPTEDPTRVFPRIQDLVNNTTSFGETLPTYSRSLQFRFVVRDNHAGTGGLDYDSLNLSVVATAGPFVVNDLNGGEIVAENETVTINWNVANTDIAPVNCSQVSIFLSTDAGFTYPITLATNEPNDGTADVTIPLGILPTGVTSLGTCRIKIKAQNNVFFDISNGNFAITSPTTPDFTLNPDTNTVPVCSPTAVINTLNVGQVLNFTDTVQLTVSGVPAGATFTFGNTEVIPGNSTTMTFDPNTVAPGNYNITVTGTRDTIVHTTDILYQVSNIAPTVTTLTYPNDNEFEVPVGATLTWSVIDFIQFYNIEIASDSTFNNIVRTATATDTNYIISPGLALETEYFWRVKSQNACGTSDWSDTLSFSTTGLPQIFGCTDSTAFNYNPDANTEDGSCEPFIYGCLNPAAINFDTLVNTDDGSCIILGCTDPTAFNYNEDATLDDGTCIIFGCTDSTSFNYNPDATNDDGSCVGFILGCIDSTALNFDPNANTDNGLCVEEILGCTDSTAYNYNPNAIIYDASCIYLPSGCTDSTYNNYDPLAGIDDGSCSNDIVFLYYEHLSDSTYNFWIEGSPGVSITSVTWTFGDSTANIIGNPQQHSFSQNGLYHVEALVTTNVPNVLYYADTLLNLTFWGCTDAYAANFNLNASVDDGSCIDAIYGCIDSTAINFNPTANSSDASCQYDISGCTDSTALNYNASANIDDGSCIPVILGCTDSTALNYNANANVDDGSCIGVISGCTDSTALNYNPAATIDDGSCIEIVLGCTDSTALNFDPTANTDDASCEYPPSTDSIWQVTTTSENHTILIPTTALMDINGGTLSNGDYIGVFYDQSGVLQCGGFIIWNGVNATITAYGAEDAEDNGFQDSENFIWQVWDVSALTTLSAEVTYDTNMPNLGEYADDGISAITGLEASSGHAIELITGWNFVSTYINPNDANIAVSMAPIAEDIFLAKDEDGLVYWPTFNINNIGDLTIGKAYKVKMDDDATWIVEGEIVNPTDYALALEEGWSYLGYLRTQEALVSSALSDITANIWLVKDGEGNVYWPQFNINNIGNMEPGQGYQINMNNSDTLTYASNAITLPSAKIAINEVPIFYPTPTRSGSNMTLALPFDQLNELAKIGDEIAAFNEQGQLIGSVIYQGSNTALTIWGDDSSTEEVEYIASDDAYTLKLWSTATNVEYALEFDLNTGEVVYAKDLITIATNLRKSIILEAWSTSIFPNPTSDILTVQIFNKIPSDFTLSIYNQLGVKVIDLNESGLTEGQPIINVNVQALTNGLYYILIEDTAGNSSINSISILH